MCKLLKKMRGVGPVRVEPGPKQPGWGWPASVPVGTEAFGVRRKQISSESKRWGAAVGGCRRSASAPRSAVAWRFPGAAVPSGPLCLDRSVSTQASIGLLPGELQAALGAPWPNRGEEPPAVCVPAVHLNSDLIFLSLHQFS